MNMASGTTGITGAVDSSFVLKESKRGSGRAALYCTGRLENPVALLDDMVRVFAEFIAEEKSFTGSPTELAQSIERHTGHGFVAAALSKKLLQSQYECESRVDVE